MTYAKNGKFAKRVGISLSRDERKADMIDEDMRDGTCPRGNKSIFLHFRCRTCGFTALDERKPSDQIGDIVAEMIKDHSKLKPLCSGVPELGKADYDSLLKDYKRLRAAAKCIKHWHDSGTEGMVVSGEYVRLLWKVLGETQDT